MIRLFSVILSLLISSYTFGQLDDSVKMTFIANSGYFIETGNKNYLIDAVFSDCIGKYSCPEVAMIDEMINGKHPFEKVDFVLITHNHPDHVNDSLIVEMLKKRDDFVLILPQQVYASLKNSTDMSQFDSKVHVIKLDTAETVDLQIESIDFNIARAKHADTYDIENLCYIINDKGFRILHTGDSWPESLTDIRTDFFSDIDLVILPISFGKDRFVTHDSLISPRHTMISHIKSDFKDKFKEIMKVDTATFGTKDALFEPYEQISYSR